MTTTIFVQRKFGAPKRVEKQSGEKFVIYGLIVVLFIKSEHNNLSGIVQTTFPIFHSCYYIIKGIFRLYVVAKNHTTCLIEAGTIFYEKWKLHVLSFSLENETSFSFYSKYQRRQRKM